MIPTGGLLGTGDRKCEQHDKLRTDKVNHGALVIPIPKKTIFVTIV